MITALLTLLVVLVTLAVGALSRMHTELVVLNSRVAEMADATTESRTARDSAIFQAGRKLGQAESTQAHEQMLEQVCLGARMERQS
jgi:hypothetical protein